MYSIIVNHVHPNISELRVAFGGQSQCGDLMPCRAGIAWGGPGLNEPLVTGCYGCWLSRTRSCTFVNSSFKRLVSLQGKPFKLSFSIQSASLESRKPSLPARYKRCWFTDVHSISGSEFSASKPYITVDAPDEDFNHFQSPESTPDFIQLSAQKKQLALGSSSSLSRVESLPNWLPHLESSHHSLESHSSRGFHNWGPRIRTSQKERNLAIPKLSRAKPFYSGCSSFSVGGGSTF